MSSAEEYMRSILECAGDVIEALDRDLIVLYVTPSVKSALGYGPDELLGTNHLGLVHSDDLFLWKECLNKAAENRGVTVGPVTIRVCHRDGSWRYLERIIKALPEEQGLPAFVMSGHDVTEARRAEQALAESEDKFKSLVENSLAAVYIAQDGVFKYVNQQFAEVYGYSISEIVDTMGPKDLTTPEDWPMVQANMQKRLSSSPPVLRYSFRSIRKDKIIIDVEVYGSCMTYQGRPAVIGTLLDITPRRRAEEELAKRAAELARSNAELEHFAYIASHDLQEPLRMVASFTELLARKYKGRLDKDADEFIEYVVDGANRMKQLINDLLAYSRIGTQGKPFNLTDCRSIFDRAVRNLALTIEEHHATVTAGPMPQIMADEIQLIQLMQNLIANAIKFHGEEMPKVHVSAEDKDGEWLFSVSDNGIGIEPKHFERIFAIFQRLHGKKKYTGTGIGLAICKKIVERHGGRIWVESEPGIGSTFYFTMPKKGGFVP